MPSVEERKANGVGMWQASGNSSISYHIAGSYTSFYFILLLFGYFLFF